MFSSSLDGRYLKLFLCISLSSPVLPPHTLHPSVSKALTSFSSWSVPHKLLFLCQNTGETAGLDWFPLCLWPRLRATACLLAWTLKQFLKCFVCMSIYWGQEKNMEPFFSIVYKSSSNLRLAFSWARFHKNWFLAHNPNATTLLPFLLLYLIFNLTNIADSYPLRQAVTILVNWTELNHNVGPKWTCWVPFVITT